MSVALKKKFERSFYCNLGGVVQWLERCNHIPNARGSNPFPAKVFATLVKVVDTSDLKSVSFKSIGSSPISRKVASVT